MTKSAIKRAQRLARIEQKQRQKELKAQLKRAGSEALSDETVNSSAPSQEPVTTAGEQVLQPTSLSSIESELPVELPDVVAEVKRNGIVHTSEPLHIAASSTAQTGGKQLSSAKSASCKATNAEGEVATPVVSNVNGSAASSKADSGLPSPQDAEKSKKRQNALTRTLWTFIMIGGFIG